MGKLFQNLLILKETKKVDITKRCCIKIETTQVATNWLIT